MIVFGLIISGLHEMITRLDQCFYRNHINITIGLIFSGFHFRPKLLKSASVTNPRVDVFQSSGKSHSEDVTSISQASSNNLAMSTQNGSRTEVVSGSNVVFLRTISSGKTNYSLQYSITHW